MNKKSFMRPIILSISLFFFFCISAQNHGVKFVEVCGVKWATGNLYFDNGKYDVFEKQYYCFAFSGLQKDNKIQYFNFGWPDGSCYPNDFFFNKKIKSICGSERWDICRKHLGRNYRLPNSAEFKTLQKKASYKKALYYFNDGKNYIEGYYYFTPKGKRVKPKSNEKPMILTDEDLSTGLFLPSLNYRQAGGHGIIQQEYKSYYYNTGFYWSGDLKNGVGIYFLTGNNNHIWSAFDESLTLGRTLSEGLCIRPIYCGEE